MNNKPIAVIDSGLGGLSILSSLLEELPNENFVYLADHQFFPYGNKTSKEINQRLIKIIDHLLSKKVKMIAIACNTITTNSIEFLRSQYSLPFIGTEPAVKVAVDKHLSKNIVVLATSATVKSPLFRNLVNLLDQDGQIKAIPCPGLVEVIETANRQKITKKITTILKKIPSNYSALVLGCTHYILVKDIFKKLAKPNVLVIEPSLAISRQTRKILNENNLLSSSPSNIPSRDGMIQYLTTSNHSAATKSARLLHKPSIIFNKCSI